MRTPGEECPAEERMCNGPEADSEQVCQGKNGGIKAAAVDMGGAAVNLRGAAVNNSRE